MLQRERPPAAGIGERRGPSVVGLGWSPEAGLSGLGRSGWGRGTRR